MKDFLTNIWGIYEGFPTADGIIPDRIASGLLSSPAPGSAGPRLQAPDPSRQRSAWPMKHASGFQMVLVPSSASTIQLMLYISPQVVAPTSCHEMQKAQGENARKTAKDSVSVLPLTVGIQDCRICRGCCISEMGLAATLNGGECESQWINITSDGREMLPTSS